MKQVKKQENETFSEKWFTTTNLLYILVGLLFVLVAILVDVIIDDKSGWIDLLDREGKVDAFYLIGIAMGGILLAIQATVSYRRAKAMEDAAQAQAKAVEQQAKANQNTEQGQRQERLKNAIEHLGHERSSVRLGGAYELFHLAEDTKALRKTVLEILCSHIRQTTRSKDYQKEYGEKPSEEIQSLLNLLFVQKHDVFDDCRINLQGSRLNGASLLRARLQKADLRKVHLQGADLSEAQLQEAKLDHAQLQRAMLGRAQLHEANLNHAQLQRANLNHAQLQGAKLWAAQLQRVVLDYAWLHGAKLHHAQLQGADINNAELRGVDLNSAQLQGADISETQLQGAILSGAQLQGANLNCVQLQEAMLNYAQLQGALLSEAQLQGAELREAQLQGAYLREAHLQGADLSEVQLQGIIDSESQMYFSLNFAERIWQRTNKESDYSTVVFSGGLSEEQVNNMARLMLDSEYAARLKARLKRHIDQPASNELPADSGARTGTYTQEDAERWIKEYKEAFNRDDTHS